MSSKPSVISATVSKSNVAADNQINEELTTCRSVSDRTCIKNLHNSTPHSRFRFVENLILIWLDLSINEPAIDTKNSITYLRQIISSVEIFTDPDQCVDFITDIIDEKVLMIISSDLDQQLVPIIQELTPLVSIYILCNDKSIYKQWIKECKKIKGMFDQIEDIYNVLKEDARQANSRLTPIGIIKESSTIDLNELDQSFMYSQLLKEVFLDTPHEEKPMKELVEFCRIQYAGNDIQMKVLDEFEQEYDYPSPIWWYTRECFTYWMLNKALRTQDTELIVKMGFFLRDLHRQIEELHSRAGHRNSFTVFRGQGMSHAEFEKLKYSKGGLLSFNNFLSTSVDRQVSYLYADSAKQNPDLIGVLFEMKIDPSISPTPFASVNNISYFEANEEEILFSMHTIFRIGEIKPIEDRLWQVNLVLTGDNDQQLKRLTQHMREEIQGETRRHRIGNLMIKMGEFDKAEEIYTTLLELTPPEKYAEIAEFTSKLGYIKNAKGDKANALAYVEKTLEIAQNSVPHNHSDLAKPYNNIGSIYYSMGEYSTALYYYEKALEIMEKSISSDYPSLAHIYSNIGSLYDVMGKSSMALSYYEKTLEIRQKYLPHNHPLLADTYKDIGAVFYSMGQYSTGLSYYEKTLEIRQKYLPPNHPSQASIYNEIGSTYDAMGDYSSALSFLEKALEIMEKSLPHHHPSVATTNSNIASVHRSMGEYSTALSYYEKALEIMQKSLPLNHPDLATIYSNIGSLHGQIGEFKTALSCNEKALEIKKKSFSHNHPSLAISYNNIGSLHQRMGAFPIALTYFEKTLEIVQGSLLPNYSSLATAYSNIGAVYLPMKEYSKALSYYEKALEFMKKSFPSNHPIMAIIYNNIGSLHDSTEEYSISLSYYTRALEIQQKSLPHNHSDLATTYNNIGTAHRKMGEYSTALSYYENALEIMQKSVSFNHPSLGTIYYNIAKSLEKLHRYKEAIAHAESAVDIARHAFGSEHDEIKQNQDFLDSLRKNYD